MTWKDAIVHLEHEHRAGQRDDVEDEAEEPDADKGTAARSKDKREFGAVGSLSQGHPRLRQMQVSVEEAALKNVYAILPGISLVR